MDKDRTISFRDGEAIGNLDKTNFGDSWGLHNWIGVLKDYSVAIKFLKRKMTSIGDDVENWNFCAFLVEE